MVRKKKAVDGWIADAKEATEKYPDGKKSGNTFDDFGYIEYVEIIIKDNYPVMKEILKKSFQKCNKNIACKMECLYAW